MVSFGSHSLGAVQLASLGDLPVSPSLIGIGVVSVHHQAQLFMWVLESQSAPHASVACILRTATFPAPWLSVSVFHSATALVQWRSPGSQRQPRVPYLTEEVSLLCYWKVSGAVSGI